MIGNERWYILDEEEEGYYRYSVVRQDNQENMKKFDNINYDSKNVKGSFGFSEESLLISWLV